MIPGWVSGSYLALLCPPSQRPHLPKGGESHAVKVAIVYKIYEHLNKQRAWIIINEMLNGTISSNCILLQYHILLQAGE